MKPDSDLERNSLFNITELQPVKMKSAGSRTWDKSSFSTAAASRAEDNYDSSVLPPPVNFPAGYLETPSNQKGANREKWERNLQEFCRYLICLIFFGYVLLSTCKPQGELRSL
jgi:hypothetical protein